MHKCISIYNISEQKYARAFLTHSKVFKLPEDLHGRYSSGVDFNLKVSGSKSISEVICFFLCIIIYLKQKQKSYCLLSKQSLLLTYSSLI